MSQIGLVDADEGARLQPLLKPGQRLVSVEGDLWRWDGFRAWAEDAPSAAALRLEQLNRLETLKQEMARATARMEGARGAHETLTARLAELTERRQGRPRGAARGRMRISPSRSAACQPRRSRPQHGDGRLESPRTCRIAPRGRGGAGAQAGDRGRSAPSPTLAISMPPAREVEDIKMTVEAARMTMMARRSAHDELRREGDARKRPRAAGNEGSERLASPPGNRQDPRRRIAGPQGRRRGRAGAGRHGPRGAGRKARRPGRAITDAEARRGEATEALAAAETALRDAITAERDAERAASDAREARAAAEARAEAAARRGHAGGAAHRGRAGMHAADSCWSTLNTDPERHARLGRDRGRGEPAQTPARRARRGQPARRRGCPRGAGRA